MDQIESHDAHAVRSLSPSSALCLNQRPSCYEPDELPGCSTPRHRYYATCRFCTMDMTLCSLSKRLGQQMFPVELTRARIARFSCEFALCVRAHVFAERCELKAHGPTPGSTSGRGCLVSRGATAGEFC